MNRAIRHDALLVWRETAAALAGWGDRVLVVIGLALIGAAARHAAADAPERVIAGAALVVGAWMGFAGGRVVERRLAFHREVYLFASDVLVGSGAWRYRFVVLMALVALALGAAAIVGAPVILPSLAGLAVGFVPAVAAWDMPLPSCGESRAPGNGVHHVVGVIGAAIVVAAALWWRGAPAWGVALPIASTAAITSRIDAEAARFDARVGRSTGETLRRLAPALSWAIGLAALAAACSAVGAAIGLAAGLAALWLGALSVMAWRMTGRRNADLIVTALIAASAVAGTMAIVLVPVALAAASVWLWRRSQAARWMVA